VSLTPIAIIGIGCRFPGAENPRAFWRMLEEGREAITPVPSWRWDADAFYDPDPAAPGKMPTKLGGFIDGIDRFDPAFFGISAEEACAMDPQQRLMLEVAWEALEDAAVVPQTLAGTAAGVFCGVSSMNYGVMAQRNPTAIGRHTNIGIGGTVSANRISYFFDLCGPSFSVDAACASSLLAVHQACESIWRGESSLAFAGGVNAVLLPGPGIGLARGGMISPDGRTRVFDAGANGWVRGEGAGVVLLKPLPQAITDSDPIYAVIRGSAVNQNGRSNGLTGPSRSAQESLLREACRRAEISPQTVGYVEAHSTGTLIGDATELAALGAVMGEGRGGKNSCMIGSVKPNIGHLEAAAGIAGLIKTAMMLKHRRLLPTLNYQRANPHFPLDRLPLRIAVKSEPWEAADGPLVAGVSASGYGGANVHVVLTEPPQVAMPADAGEPDSHRLLLSARNGDALKTLAERYARFLDAEPRSLADVCHTSQVGRSHMAHRMAVPATNPQACSRLLEMFIRGESHPDILSGKAQRGREAFPLAQPDRHLTGRRLHGLPTYPFQRERYWMEIAAGEPAAPVKADQVVAASVPVIRPAVLPDPMPPRNDVERKLVSIWEWTLGVSPVGVRDSFFELGGTSALSLKLFTHIEEDFDAVLPLASLYSSPTVEQFARLLSFSDGPARWEPVVSLNDSGLLPPLFFVPGLGGHAFDLRTLAARIGPDQPVCVLHPHGLDPRQVPLTRVEEMAAAFLKHVRSIQAVGPYRLGGYSFGASVAFEMARQLEAQRESTALMVMLDGYAPEAFVKQALPIRVARHAQRLWAVGRGNRRKYVRERAGGIWRRLHAAALGGAGAPAAGASAVVDAVQRVTDANAAAWRSYRPGTYSGRVALFRAHPREESVRLFCVMDPQNGWAPHALGGVEVIALPCDHLEVFHEPYINLLADGIRTRLERVAPKPNKWRASA
jgi:3-oxoacyl-(acyl-carrier-protein) synthase/thioesterase domain-containing protein